MLMARWTVDDAIQADVEYNENYIRGLSSYSKRHNRIDTYPRN